MNGVQNSDSQIIRIDRSARLIYPEWVRTVPDGDREDFGPVEFSVKSLIQEYPDGPGIESLVPAGDIFESLEKNKMRKRCLGFREAQAIREKGIYFFCEHFGGEAVFCWRCVAGSNGGFNHVLFIFEFKGEVEIGWFPLDIRRTVVNKLVYFPG